MPMALDPKSSVSTSSTTLAARKALPKTEHLEGESRNLIEFTLKRRLCQFGDWGSEEWGVGSWNEGMWGK